MNKFLRIKLLSSILVLSFVTVQTCPCAYAFSLPFKKKKTEKIEQTKETSAVQIKAEKNEIVEYSLEDCIDIALKNDPNIKIYTTQKGTAALIVEASARARVSVLLRCKTCACCNVWKISWFCNTQLQK